VQVLMPSVEASVLLFEAGLSSAWRTPVWIFVEAGAKIDSSLMVT
jgi:hypothetical protein